MKKLFFFFLFSFSLYSQVNTNKYFESTYGEMLVWDKLKQTYVYKAEGDWLFQIRPFEDYYEVELFSIEGDAWDTADDDDYIDDIVEWYDEWHDEWYDEWHDEWLIQKKIVSASEFAAAFPPKVQWSYYDNGESPNEDHYFTTYGRKIIFNYEDQEVVLFYDYSEKNKRYLKVMIASKIKAHDKVYIPQTQRKN